MDLVVDANILVAELIRKRGRELILHPAWKLYIAEKAWEEACYELEKRINIMINRGSFSEKTGRDLLKDAFALAEQKTFLIPYEFYYPYQSIALSRIPRDPDDWPTVAVALFLQTGIWTSDQDFFGCGMATWTTETLISYLTNEYQ